MEFENYFKHIPVSFKVHADCECNLRGVESYEGFYIKNIKIMFLVVLLIKLFTLMILSKLLFIDVKMQLMNLLKHSLKSINIARK